MKTKQIVAMGLSLMLLFTGCGKTESSSQEQPVSSAEPSVVSEADILNMDEFSKKLTLAGYSACETVEGAGQFAVRGGIIDVFPITSDCPYRIDMFGDEVDTIRGFDVTTQLSGDRVKSITVPPAYEILYDYETAEKIAEELKLSGNPD